MISIWLLAFDGYMMCWLLDLDFDPHSNNATCTACHHLWIYDRTEMHLLLLGYHYHYRKTILYQIFTLYRLREMWHWPRDFTFDLFIIELDVILAKLASIICFLMIASILCHLKFLITTFSVFKSSLQWLLQVLLTILYSHLCEQCEWFVSRLEVHWSGTVLVWLWTQPTQHYMSSSLSISDHALVMLSESI